MVRPAHLALALGLPAVIEVADVPVYDVAPGHCATTAC